MLYANPWTTKQNFMAGESQLNIVVPNTISSLFLYNINTRESVELKLVPDQIAETYSQKIVSISPFGILHPINYYVGGNEKTLDFDFDMHEDLSYNNIDGSIYTLIAKIKYMSQPTSSVNRLNPPLVYLQLGTQFAGKGHLSTTFGFKKPFSGGRYKSISCSLQFVFHEVFNTPVTGLFFDNTTEEILGDSYSITTVPESFSAKDISIEDFYSMYFDYDYIKTQSFANEKIRGVFNLVATANNVDVETLYSAVENENLVLLNSGLSQNYNSDIIGPLIRYFATFLTIVKNWQLNQIVLLEQLLKDIESYGNTMFNITQISIAREEGIAGEYETLLQGYFQLRAMVKQQIAAYNSLYGAGD